MKNKIASILAVLFLLSFFYSNYKRQTPKSEYDYNLLGKTPVLMGGRIQPLDSIAKNSLLTMNGKRSTKAEDGKKRQAIEWLAELMFDFQKAGDRPVFRIYDEGIRAILPKKEATEKRSEIAALLLGKGSSQFYYSLNEIRPHFEKLQQDAIAADKIEEQLRSLYESSVVNLVNAIIRNLSLSTSIHHGQTSSFVQELESLRTLVPAGLEAIEKRERGEEFDQTAFQNMLSIGAAYQRMESNSAFFTIPEVDASGEINWEKASSVLGQITAHGQPSDVTTAYSIIVDAYRDNDPQTFNAGLVKLHEAIAAISPKAFGKSAAEQRFNHLEPFYISMVGYVIVLILSVLAWLKWPDTLEKAALYTSLTAFLIHSLGMGYRMYISGYAPVTNLYSSAVFVGWGVVGLSLVLERIFKNGLCNVVASIVGFSTLILAHHLGNNGDDTLGMMQAVLDSNFWLSTHVPTVTFGYVCNFLAGAIALVFVGMGVFTKRITPETEKSVKSMVYGIICFATLTSFVGTVLGGIWADQSWGRFWGWDPKENGAILLVLWNIIILHCRWGGFIKTRGLMMMAIFGSIVTAWSWMGTNLLGVGLHSYGFTTEGAFYLFWFWVSQAIFIALAALPASMWKSKVRL